MSEAVAQAEADVRPPSKDALAKAQRLAGAVELPDAVQASALQCARYSAAVRAGGGLGMVPPTPQQVAYAKLLAGERVVPEPALRARSACYRFSASLDALDANGELV